MVSLPRQPRCLQSSESQELEFLINRCWQSTICWVRPRIAIIENCWVESEDVAQEVVIKVWERREVVLPLPTLDQSYFWHRIRKAKYYDILRQSHNRSHSEFWRTNFDLAVVGTIRMRQDAVCPYPLRQAANLETVEITRRLLSGLKPKEHQVLLLRHEEGLPWKEVGRILNCSADAAQACARRARKRFLRLLLETHPSLECDCLYGDWGQIKIDSNFDPAIDSVNP